jgi:hypothetical protein
MKLVESSAGKDGCELPAAESCALDEGEEDDVDKVIFTRGGKKSKANRNREDGEASALNSFERDTA